jgi:hypothetical protein
MPRKPSTPTRAPKAAKRAALIWEFQYLQTLLADRKCTDESLRNMVAHAVAHALDPVRAVREDAEQEAEYKRTKPEREARLNELLGEGWNKKSNPNA